MKTLVVKIKEKAYQIKYGSMMFFSYEYIKGETFKPSISNFSVLFYAGLVNTAKEEGLIMTFEEFVNWLDENPGTFEKFVKYVAESEEELKAKNDGKQ